MPQKCCIYFSLKMGCIFAGVLTILICTLHLVSLILYSQLDNNPFKVVMCYISTVCVIIAAFLFLYGVKSKRSSFFALWYILTYSLLTQLIISFPFNVLLQIDMKNLVYHVFCIFIVFHVLRVVVSYHYQLMKEASECNTAHIQPIPDQIIEDHFPPSYSCLFPEQQEQQIQSFNNSYILGTTPPPTV